MSIILAYIFYFIAASASPLQRRWLAKKKDIDGKSQVAFAFRVYFIVSIISLSLPIFSPFYIAGNFYYIFLLALVVGIFGAISIITGYIVQKHVEAGVFTLVSNIYTPIAIFLSYFLLNEKLTPIQMIGTILLLIALVIVSKKHRISKFRFDKYFILMILGGIVFAFDIVAERILMRMTGFTASTMIIIWSQCLFIGIYMLATKSKNYYSKKDILITGTLRFFQILSWFILVFVVGNLSVVSSITTFKVVIMFIAGAIILKEHDDMKRKILGSIIAVIGLLLMK